MEGTNLSLFMSIAIPMAITLLIFKGRSRISMLFVIVGMAVCLFTGEINTLIFNFTKLEMKYYVVNVSPFVEELCKSVPLFLYAYILRPKKQDVLESAVSLGVGFAVLENAAVLAEYGGMNVLVRSFGSGLMHAITALWIGCGIIFVYLNRKLFYTGSFAILISAAIFHSAYNALIGSSYEIVGLLLPIITLVPLSELLIKKGINKKNTIQKGEI